MGFFTPKVCGSSCLCNDGGDICWPCGNSYPSSVTVEALGGPEGACCEGMLGTYVTAPWGETVVDTEGPLPGEPSYYSSGISHYSFGNTDDTYWHPLGKNVCRAIWSGLCSPFNEEEGSSHQRFWIDILVGDKPILSRQVRAFLRILHYQAPGSIYDRIEEYELTLPNPCPTSGIFELDPTGTPYQFSPDLGEFPYPENCSSSSHLHSVVIEI